MIATTIEQCERLLACGIKAETADMVYIITPPIDREYISSHDIQLQAIPYTNSIIWGNERKKPAWSLSALLTDVLPPVVNVNLEAEIEIGITSGEWYCEYRYTTLYVSASDPIEACVKMVELLSKEKLL